MGDDAVDLRLAEPGAADPEVEGVALAVDRLAHDAQPGRLHGRLAPFGPAEGMDVGRIAALLQVFQEGGDRGLLGGQAVLDHQAAAGLQRPGRFPHEAGNVVEVVRRDAAGHQVDRPARKGQGVHVADPRRRGCVSPISAARRRATAIMPGATSRPTTKPRAAAQGRRQARCGVAGPGGEIEAGLAGGRRGERQDQVQVAALGVGRAGGVGLGLAREEFGRAAGRSVMSRLSWLLRLPG